MPTQLYKENFDTTNDIGRPLVVTANGFSTPIGVNGGKMIIRPMEAIYIGTPSSNSKFLQFGNTGDNVFVGQDTGVNQTTAYSNTALGNSSLLSITTGYQNVALGQFAGNGNSIGGVPSYKNIDQINNIFIGNKTGVATGINNSVVIGELAVANSSNTVVLGSVNSVNTAGVTQGVITGGITLNSTAQLQVDSTTKGFLPPRMTTAQRDVIGSPAEGLVIYNTSTKVLNVFNGTSWIAS